MPYIVENIDKNTGARVGVWSDGTHRGIRLWDQVTQTQADCNTVGGARMEIEMFRQSEHALSILSMLGRDESGDIEIWDNRFEVALHKASVVWERLLNELISEAPTANLDAFNGTIRQSQGMCTFVPCPMCGQRTLHHEDRAAEVLCISCNHVLSDEL